MSIKIFLINEPFVKNFCRTQRWAARTRARVMRAPDWLAYATAVLEQANYDAKLFDFPAKNWDKKYLLELLKKEQPDFVVLDSTTPSIYSDIDCARIVKENSSAKVIMVGPHASAVSEDTLRKAAGLVDVIAIGEYDYTVKDIIENFSNLDKVQGIAYLKNDEFVRTKNRPLIENLDELPFPSWHHLNLMDYFDGGKLYPYIDIISGRGCPNQCIFCLWPQVMHGTKYRFRSAANVVDEIEYDIKLCPQVLKGGEFFFEDDTFTVNKSRAIEICEEILRRKLKIIFSVNARVDTADLELFKIMKKAGCRELLVGFESGSQDILDKANKNISIQQSKQFMDFAKKAGLEVHGCFVIGLPGETKKTAEDTINFALNLGLNTAQFSGAVPFPGTKYYEICEDNDWLSAKDWSDWLDDGEQSSVVKYENLEKKDIIFYVNKGLKKFYFRPFYMIKFLFKTKNLADLYRKARGAKNFFGYLFKK